MSDELVTESELKDIVHESLDREEERYGVSVGLEEDGFEVHITYEETDLPSIGRPLDEIRDSTGLDGEYNVRADFRPNEYLYTISVTKIDD